MKYDVTDVDEFLDLLIDGSYGCEPFNASDDNPMANAFHNGSWISAAKRFLREQPMTIPEFEIEAWLADCATRINHLGYNDGCHKDADIAEYRSYLDSLSVPELRAEMQASGDYDSRTTVIKTLRKKLIESQKD